MSSAERLTAAVEVELDLLADAVVERLVGRLEQAEPEPEPGFFGSAAAAREQEQATFLAALTGRATAPSTEAGPGRPSGFDGGARQGLPPPPESHDSWLVRALRTGAADRGASF